MKRLYSALEFYIFGKNFIMKKLLASAVLGLLILSSCAQKKEQREEYKDAYSAEHMRNSGGDSAVSATSQIDSTNAAEQREAK